MFAPCLLTCIYSALLWCIGTAGCQVASRKFRTKKIIQFGFFRIEEAIYHSLFVELGSEILVEIIFELIAKLKFILINFYGLSLLHLCFSDVLSHLKSMLVQNLLNSL